REHVVGAVAVHVHEDAALDSGRERLERGIAIGRLDRLARQRLVERRLGPALAPRLARVGLAVGLAEGLSLGAVVALRLERGALLRVGLDAARLLVTPTRPL